MKSSNRLWWSVFVVMVVIQLAIYFGSIVRWERVSAQGEVFKIRCEPVDPYDPFRGRYVSLNLGRTLVKPADGESFERDSHAFARIEAGPDGFARFTSLHSKPPSGGAFIRCRVGYEGPDGKYAIRLPFDRFFLNEKLAPEAEFAFREALRSGEEPEVWIQLRVLKNDGVIEELYIDGRPIAEVAREAVERKARAPAKS